MNELPIAIETAKLKERAIAENLPEPCDVKDLSAVRLENGVEIYSHKGVPFLKMYPLEFSEPKMEGDKYIVTATQNYKVMR